MTFTLNFILSGEYSDLFARLCFVVCLEMWAFGTQSVWNTEDDISFPSSVSSEGRALKLQFHLPLEMFALYYIGIKSIKYSTSPNKRGEGRMSDLQKPKYSQVGKHFLCCEECQNEEPIGINNFLPRLFFKPRS